VENPIVSFISLINHSSSPPSSPSKHCTAADLHLLIISPPDCRRLFYISQFPPPFYSFLDPLPTRLS
jgi:hypothetical protein